MLCFVTAIIYGKCRYFNVLLYCFLVLLQVLLSFLLCLGFELRAATMTLFDDI